MTYLVKEIFYTLQGEGANAGTPAVFLRFALCNLWTGRERDRHRAVCKFCDTDFVGIGPDGGRFATADDAADAVLEAWTGGLDYRMVVCTGGEPLLQLDQPLVHALRDRGFLVAVETNGTLPLPPATVIDWVCVSPKAGAPLVLTEANEVKVVWPQPGIDLDALAAFPAEHHFLQPLDNADRAANIATVVEHCLSDPRWKLSLQTHKLIGVR